MTSSSHALVGTASAPLLTGLLPHQRKIVPSILDMIAVDDCDRTTVVMACGTGKTRVAQRVAEVLVANAPQVPAEGRSARILVLLPSLALIAQTFESWVAAKVVGFEALGFCSSADVKVKHAGSADADGLSVLTDANMTSTTDPDDLLAWVTAGPSTPGGNLVVFATYHSAHGIEAAHRDGLGPWDLMICDEAHNTTGDLLDGAFSIPLHQDRIPARKRIFFTATPKVHRKRGRKISDASAEGIASMNDPAVYGRRAVEYLMPQGVADQVINDYKAVILDLADKQVEDMRAVLKDHHPDLFGTTGYDSDEVLAALALFRAAKAYDLHRILTFHNSVKRAERFGPLLQMVAEAIEAEAPEELHVAAANMRFLSVKGGDTLAHRKQVKAAVADTAPDALTVLSNCKVFGEGVDLPSLDGLLLADERRSPVEVTQIVGRVTRRNRALDPEVDQYGVLILPVINNPDADPTETVQASTYEKVWQTLIALGEHDPDMAADLDRINRETAAAGICDALSGARASGVPQQAVGAPKSSSSEISGSDVARVDSVDHSAMPTHATDGPAGSAASAAEHSLALRKIDLGGPARPGVPVSSDAFIRAFTARAVERVIESWERTLAEVVAWAAANSRMPRKQCGDALETRYGMWLSNQRQDATPERRAILDERLPGWSTTRVSADSWERTLTEVAAWAAANDRMPRKRGRDAQETQYGVWLVTQRRDATPERRAILDERLPGWSTTSRSVGAWERRVAEVAAWVAANDRMARCEGGDAQETRYGVWLVTQRRNASPERRAILDEHLPGWSTTHRSPDVWTRTLAEVVAWAAANARVPRKAGGDAQETRYGVWVAAQRKNASPERRAILDERLPGWSTTRQSADTWERRIAEVVAWVAENGRMPRQTGGDALERRYGGWLGDQRRKANSERRAILDERLPAGAARVASRFSSRPAR